MTELGGWAAHPTVPGRRRLPVVYLLLLASPVVVILALSHAEVTSWWMTGMCPGGPMDRPAAPCAFPTFFFVVVLGGWLAYLVVPALSVWWIGWTLWYLGRRANALNRGR